MKTNEDVSRVISMDKQYTTRDGRAVQLLTIEAGGSSASYPIVGLIGPSKQLVSWRQNGQYGLGSVKHSYDLIEVKKTAVIKGVMFYWVSPTDGGLVAQACTTTSHADCCRHFLRSVGWKFTETPFELEVEIPS